MNKEDQGGMIVLEACISVLTFVMLLLFFSSFFLIFMAQTMTSHTIMQAAQSLALDVHKTESMIKEDDGTLGQSSDLLTTFVVRLFGSSSDNPHFVSDTHWHKEDSGKKGVRDIFDGSYSETGDETVDKSGASADKVAAAVKLKFIGYFSGGDEDAGDTADQLLKNMNVVDGLDGLDFSDSYVEDDILYIVLKYELEYDFDLWGVDNLEVVQKACARLWKVK